ncbi:MAG: hypothetical protein AAGG44_09745, partial [Planctomycetota bacterium]
AIARLSTNRIEQLDQILAEANLPPTTELLLQSRLALLLQPGSASVIRPTAEETLVLSPRIESMCQAALTDARDCGRRLSALSWQAGFREYEESQESQRIQCQRVQTAIQLAAFANTLPRRSKKVKEAIASGVLSKIDFEQVTSELTSALNELYQAEVDLRVNRCAKVSHVLVDSSAPKDKLLATVALISDAVFFHDYLPKDLLPEKIKRSTNGRLDRSRALLVDRSVLETLPRAFENVDERDLWLAFHFDAGLRWWLRGRFGSGPLGGGLLKDPRAKGSKSVLIQLDMPISFPDLAQGPADQDSLSSFCERRHHYQWQWENRRIAIGDQPRNYFTNPEEYEVRWKQVFT